MYYNNYGNKINQLLVSPINDITLMAPVKTCSHCCLNPSRFYLHDVALQGMEQSIKMVKITGKRDTRLHIFIVQQIGLKFHSTPFIPIWMICRYRPQSFFFFLSLREQINPGVYVITLGGY